ncbi:FeoB-associated Cys-rich membrane protein [Microbacter margulisiae]|uniref:Putative cysteine cluster protein YcgN (CxxCxxCC family) n=1 Tax=Microbacter margulisiae TaxID=1350067 RepID=A0A7W5DQ96_9PORP|nr:putative cysteine cluster protein YcgN (CxxCxxCC family) [Microbacter margulisiae]
MIQDIIVILVIAIALYFAIKKLIKQMHPKKKGSLCDGCSGCTLKNDLTKHHISCDHMTSIK